MLSRTVLFPFLCGVALVRVSNSRLLVVAVVDQYAVAKQQRFAFGNCPASVLFRVARKFPQSKWIGREQAVSSSVPVGGMAKAFRAVENGDANVFAGNLAVIVHPIRTLPPNGLFSFGAGRTHHMGRRGIQFRGHSDGKRSFFGVAHGYRTVVGMDNEFAIDGAGVLVTAENVRLNF